MTDDRRLVVAVSAAARRPPHADLAPRGGDQPRQPAVAVERIADERQRAEVRRQRRSARAAAAAGRRQRTGAQRRQSVVVEQDSLKSRRVTRPVAAAAESSACRRGNAVNRSV